MVSFVTFKFEDIRYKPYNGTHNLHPLEETILRLTMNSILIRTPSTQTKKGSTTFLSFLTRTLVWITELSVTYNTNDL